YPVDRFPWLQAGDSWAEHGAPDGGMPPCPSSPFGGGVGVATAPPASIPAGPAGPAASPTPTRTRFSPQPYRAGSYARFDKHWQGLAFLCCPASCACSAISAWFRSLWCPACGSQLSAHAVVD